MTIDDFRQDKIEAERKIQDILSTLSKKYDCNIDEVDIKTRRYIPFSNKLPNIYTIDSVHIKVEI